MGRQSGKSISNQTNKASATKPVSNVIPIKQGNNEEEWFGDRQTLNQFNHAGESDGESIWLMSYADMMTLLFGFFVMISSFSKIDIDQFEKLRMETTHLFGGEYKKVHHELVKEIKGNFQSQGVTDKALFQELDKGVAITFRGSAFFDSASAELRPEAIEILKKIIPSIKKQTQKFLVIVEGHTDDNPIATKIFPSNWELSSQRASAVLRVFETEGFQRSQLRAIGFADTVPIVPNRSPSNVVIAENQSQNRRVVIKLVRDNK